MISTCDPNVVIEQKFDGYVRYRNVVTGRRWEVYGTCDRRGDCLIGAVVQGEMIKGHAHLAQLGYRPDSELDVPVSPEFNTCCGNPKTGVFIYVEL